MTTVQYISIIFAIAIMVVGLYMIVRSVKTQKKTKTGAEQALFAEKNGIPVVPRHQRQVSDVLLAEEQEQGEQLDDEAIAGIDDNQDAQLLETQIANSAFEQANAQFITDYDPDNVTSDFEPKSQEKSYQGKSTQALDGISNTSDTAEALDTKHTVTDECDDVFSSLASATEKLMPVIETAQEPMFEANSPMLDQHLLAEADHDQNSPLNHAEENINITLIPANEYETIDGKKILALVNQYGLKYGAMNMFHRYEHKDGSGILWFSMMGITEDGIAPFDLNMLPSSRYNGLVLFLSLPHPKAIQGFDSMMSVVNLISNDLNALILDENNEVLTRERRHQLRAQVQQYQAATQGL
ncbi:cell division protein ZipA C-terminal FtsZ-binding domain-containing protein [Psychrobacter lutiphocae]|uniref:cell division protein ZipA C-terminal FtsZ-binding domain-containing protein n=1 Tax=Psychrobacter lutiphocae TaxID=540500 RepID=UPI0003829E24|nr:cell division protein ZipA C-terminal FtsZ-binding domain-containing protein [Psychrobacter lutiphocae]